MKPIRHCLKRWVEREKGSVNTMEGWTFSRYTVCMYGAIMMRSPHIVRCNKTKILNYLFKHHIGWIATVIITSITLFDALPTNPPLNTPPCISS
jgi:Sec-independent protein secretion pathway component TatC